MKQRLTYVALSWGLLAMLGLLIDGRLRGGLTVNTWRLVEAGVVLTLLLSLAAYRPVWIAFRGLGLTQGLALVGLFGLIASGQIVDRPRATYPFVPWSMYSEPQIVPEYIEYLATLESGIVIDLPFHQVIPTHERRSVSYGFNRRLGGRNESGPDQGSLREVERLILSIAEIYTQRHPNDPIQHVDVRYRSVPLDEFEGEASVTSEQVVRYMVSGTPP